VLFLINAFISQSFTHGTHKFLPVLFPFICLSHYGARHCNGFTLIHLWSRQQSLKSIAQQNQVRIRRQRIIYLEQKLPLRLGIYKHNGQ
jgi:hypothetical protein